MLFAGASHLCEHPMSKRRALRQMRCRSAYMIATHRLLHMNMATGARHRTFLYPFLSRPVYLVPRYQLLQILLPISLLHNLSFRRYLGRPHVLNDQLFSDLDRTVC